MKYGINQSVSPPGKTQKKRTENTQGSRMTTNKILPLFFNSQLLFLLHHFLTFFFFLSQITKPIKPSSFSFLSTTRDQRANLSLLSCFYFLPSKNHQPSLFFSQANPFIKDIKPPSLDLFWANLKEDLSSDFTQGLRLVACRFGLHVCGSQLGEKRPAVDTADLALKVAGECHVQMRIRVSMAS